MRGAKRPSRCSRLPPPEVRQAIEREVTRAVYVRAMFSTAHDEANREVFLKEPADTPDLVGLAVRGQKKAVDKAIKGLSLHE
ncbi:hypothetical protein ABH944_005204 [Caballeronia udeis]|uniref:Uncharacterized protein n=1 Tax=Caballeronia udeis TaxID=1232866 RepID=A0ABW8MN08_9BURK